MNVCKQQTQYGQRINVMSEIVCSWMLLCGRVLFTPIADGRQELTLCPVKQSPHNVEIP